jgi:hypothetical protein
MPNPGTRRALTVYGCTAWRQVKVSARRKEAGRRYNSFFCHLLLFIAFAYNKKEVAIFCGVLGGFPFGLPFSGGAPG